MIATAGDEATRLIRSIIDAAVRGSTGQRIRLTAKTKRARARTMSRIATHVFGVDLDDEATSPITNAAAIPTAMVAPNAPRKNQIARAERPLAKYEREYGEGEGRRRHHCCERNEDELGDGPCAHGRSLVGFAPGRSSSPSTAGSSGYRPTRGLITIPATPLLAEKATMSLPPAAPAPPVIPSP